MISKRKILLLITILSILLLLALLDKEQPIAQGKIEKITHSEKTNFYLENNKNIFIIDKKINLDKDKYIFVYGRKEFYKETEFIFVDKIIYAN